MEQAVNLETQTYLDGPRKPRQPTESVGGKIFQKIPLIMAEVGHVAKGRRNTQQGYAFRGVDDVYQAVQAILAKHGVFSAPYVEDERTEERTTKGGSALIYRVLTIRHRFYADDGSYFDARVIGEGMDSGDKASNKAMSVADKYSLLEVFKIPTAESKDPEDESHDLNPKGGQSNQMPTTQSPPAKSSVLKTKVTDQKQLAAGAQAAAAAAVKNVTPPPPKDPNFNHEDSQRREQLLNTLNSMKYVPKEDHLAICEVMHGRPATTAELKKVVEEVRLKRVAAAAGQPPIDEEYPL